MSDFDQKYGATRSKKSSRIALISIVGIIYLGTAMAQQNDLDPMRRFVEDRVRRSQRRRLGKNDGEAIVAGGDQVQSDQEKDLTDQDAASQCARASFRRLRELGSGRFMFKDV